MKSDIYNLLAESLATNNQALVFACEFVRMCHAIDDLIDETITDSELIVQAFCKTISVCSLPFYQQYVTLLYPLLISASNAYADSVKLEKQEEQWKRNYADVLRQAGNEVLVMVVDIVNGYESKREFSLKLRDISYADHHDEEGNIV